MSAAGAEGRPVAGARAARVLALAIVAGWALWAGQGLADGAPVLNDEFLTLARAEGFLADDGSWLRVQENHTRSLRKPPLQYWGTALLLRSGVDRVLALRLPSFASGVGILLLTLALARSLVRSPWGAPAALLLLVSSPMLAWMARTGMLETGMVFFQLLAITALVRADRNPRWWLVVGGAVGLGFLQKAPIALATCVFLLLVLGPALREPGYRGLWRDPWFRAGAVVAGVLCVAWPLIQTLLYGSEYLERFFGQQIWQRFVPGPATERLAETGPWRWLRWLLADRIEPGRVTSALGRGLSLVWLAGLVAVAAAVFAPGARRRPALFALACWVCVVLVVFSVAGGAIYPRYLLGLLPILAILLAAAILRLAPRAGWGLAVCALLLATRLPALAPVPEWTRGEPGAWPEIAARFRAEILPHETPVYLAPRDDPAFARPAFFVYADVGRPVLAISGLRWKTFRRRADVMGLEPPYFGLVRADGMDFVHTRLGPVVEVDRVGDFVLWRQVAPAPGVAGAGEDR